VSGQSPDLQRAERLLESGLPGSSRMAAWLARSALEEGVVRRLRQLGHDTRHASMRSRLICLHVLDPDRATDAEFAWQRLSGACHQHAFELAPTAHEVRALLTLVERVRQGQDVPTGFVGGFP
jgi:hypothetical protein